MPEIPSQVLIIDHDFNVSESLVFWLENNNFLCSAVSNEKLALDLVNKKQFDIVFFELNMPDFDVFSFVKELRAIKEFEYIPLIAFCIEREDELLSAILNAGVDDYIVKPFSENIFLSKLKVNLKKAATRKSILKKNNINNISYDEGEILYCMSNKELSPVLLPDDIRIRSVFNLETLFQYIEANNVWILLIDQAADWALENINKILHHVDETISFIILTDDEFVEKIDFEVDNFLNRNQSVEYIIQQLRFYISREKQLKKKYLNAMQLATTATAFSFSRLSEKQYNNFTVSILHEPYANIPGGDFCEFFSYSEKLKIVFFGDIMGKAWGAWFFVPAYIAYIRSTIKFMTFRNIKNAINSPGKILEALNKYLFQDLRFSNVFTTLNVAIIDLDLNIVRVSCAGALPPLFYNAQNAEIDKIVVKGILLGIHENTKYSKVDIPFSSGDKLLFYTDGYSEAVDRFDGNMLGVEGVRKVFTSLSKKNAISALDFDNEVNSTFEINQFDDDRSALLISFN